MNKTINLVKMSQIGVFSVRMLMVVVAFSFFGISNAYASISRSLDLGSTGSDVTELQSYLAKNVNLYPSGLITGYFGPLTEGGVQKFQTAQGIVSSGTPQSTGYGRVGPTTMARLNSLMGGIYVPQSSYDASPSLSSPSVNYSNTTAMITWTSNELTQGQVYWDKIPLQFSEASGARQQPFVSGTLALDAGGLQNNHTVTISNLQANTTYYYLVRGVDNVGNMSMTWPHSFRTNQ